MEYSERDVSDDEQIVEDEHDKSEDEEDDESEDEEDGEPDEEEDEEPKGEEDEQKKSMGRYSRGHRGATKKNLKP